jgi:hypothetical protein
MSFAWGHSSDRWLERTADTSKLGCDESTRSTGRSSACLTSKDVVPNGVSLDQCETKSGCAEAGAFTKSIGSSCGSAPLTFANHTNGLILHNH